LDWKKVQGLDQEIDVRNRFSILQWNIQGLNTKSTALWLHMIKNDLKIAMLQEVQTQYKTYFQALDFTGYHKVTDYLNKTVIYIKDGIKFQQIKLDLKSYGNRKEDILYASSIIIQLKMGSSSKSI